MVSKDVILAETILEAFRLAYWKGRVQVAEHLLRALERLEQDGCNCGCCAKAYGLLVQYEGPSAKGKA
ncbi:MAG: hypothetical protein VYB05_08350 [Pseudomonadota bacterium]|nr:hypothetical protein [Pseudomonadota bacterium]